MVEKTDVAPHLPDWWSQFYAPMQQFGHKVAEFFSPSAEAAFTDEAYEIALELPGVADEDISVEVQDGRLTVTGEKRSAHEETGKGFYFSERVYGTFRRAFKLPDDADESRIHAVHKDGVLTVMIAKHAPKAAKATKVEVSAG